MNDSFGNLSNNARAWLVVGGVALVVALCLGAATAANRAGWIPHRQETTVYVGVAEWAKGESRNCVALPETNGSMIFLGCVGERRPEMSPEVWPVTYWGQTRREDMYQLIHENPGNYAWRWRCQRHSGSLTCWALN
jgi:hypothetical protein